MTCLILFSAALPFKRHWEEVWLLMGVVAQATTGPPFDCQWHNLTSYFPFTVSMVFGQ